MRYTGHFTIVDEILGQNELSMNSNIRASKVLSIKEESQLLMNYFQHHILDNCVFVLTDGDRSLVIKCHAWSISLYAVKCLYWMFVLDPLFLTRAMLKKTIISHVNLFVIHLINPVVLNLFHKIKKMIFCDFLTTDMVRVCWNPSSWTTGNH